MSLAHTSRSLIVENMVNDLQVACQLGCGALVPYLKSVEHVTDECALAPIACPLGRLETSVLHDKLRFKSVCEFTGSCESLREHITQHCERSSEKKDGQLFSWKLVTPREVFNESVYWTRVFPVKFGNATVDIFTKMLLCKRGVMLIPKMLTEGFDETTYEVRLSLP